jgi:hypothetical protein
MLTKNEKRLLEEHIYRTLKESYMEGGLDFGNTFARYENKEETDDSDEKAEDDEKSRKHDNSEDMISLSDYDDLDEHSFGELKTIIPVLTSTFDDDVNTYNLTHSQLAYEMYGDLDPDTARSKFSQKVTGKKRFTAKEINQLFNIISGKIA